MKKRLKKGFTLAELLIVVAIIAVLTAIAVPLFVTSLNNAKDSTKEANIRVVRVAAVYEILSNQETYMNESETTYKTVQKQEDGSLKYAQSGAATNEFAWYITATIDSNGDITDMKIWAAKQTSEDDTIPSVDPDNGKFSACNTKGGKYYVQVVLTEDKLVTGK